jgi:hypothetical protein
MNKTYYSKVSFFVLFVLLIILFSSVIFFVKHSKEDRLLRLGDSVITDFKAGLDYEMVDLLSFSMALSEDGELKNALIADNESKGHKILSHITERFKKYTHLKSLRIQVFTPDFFIFSRSWNEGFEGMPIWWFRNDLTELLKNQEPKVGMETGRLLTFKATVPIRSGNKVLGYLEVIKFIDEFALKLRNKDIELYAFMEEKHLMIAELMKDFPQMHGYVLSNQNANQQFIDNIEMLDWEGLKAKHHIYEDDTLYLYEPMYNGKKEEIGIYILAISDDALENYEKEKQNISFFTQFSDADIAKVVEAWENPHGSFSNKEDKTLFDLLPKLEQEDKLTLKQDAQERLRLYSKEELIDIVIANKHNEKKVGKIE